jgi:hypothetical protein
MGRSFAPLSHVASADRYDPAAQNPFEKSGIQFRVDLQDGHVLHRASHPVQGSAPLFNVANEVTFVLGSGSHGRSYLVNHEGYLFQSPISWYTQRQTWDLAPGYIAEQLFDRPIGSRCLFCHCNEAQPVADTLNRYRGSLPGDNAIGCERCHGPGELHVREHNADRPAPEGRPVVVFDTTIVHPRRLEPALRDAICEQCHLQGEARVVRRGRDVFDFRPGLPLERFWAVFVRPPELAENHAIGQVEQMHASRCYVASQGQLGCISCHDPHVLPAPEEKAAYYRQRCLKCHEGKPGQAVCGLPAEARRRQNNDACAACHMPRARTTDIAHTAMSDHYLRRRPANPESSGPPRRRRPGEVPLLAFHRPPPGDEDAARDLALALVELADQQPLVAEELSQMALRALEAARQRAPGDVPALEGWAFALKMQSRGHEALAAFEEVLARVPERETTLTTTAELAADLGKTDVAIAYWERALAVNPWRASAHVSLARLVGRRREWRRAAKECRAALRINPAQLPPRQLLVDCLLNGGNREAAWAEFQNLLEATQPAQRADLQRLYAGVFH